MDINRLRRGEQIAGIAGIALVIIMFLKWWSVPGLSGQAAAVADQFGVDTGLNAWQPADFMDIIWFITALSAIGLGALAASQTRFDLPVALSAVVTGLGGLSTLLILYRLIDPPYNLDRSYGVFLGLIAAAAITYGGWITMQEEGTSFAGEADRVRDRDTGGPPPPAGGTGTPPPPAGGTGTGAPPSSGGTGAPPPSSGGPAA
jgi:hypothetical protein